GAARPAHPGAAGRGYALLARLLDDERHVSMLLIIKRERDQLEEVIDAIDDTCDKAWDDLNDLADDDPPVDLENSGLPAAELQTREGIRETRKKELLDAKGRELEFQLLLTQNEALTYGAHLAETLSRTESNPERLAFERALWKDLSRLQLRVRDLLRQGVPPDA